MARQISDKLRRRMFGFGKSTPPTRDELLRRAEDFRTHKKPKKAVAELRKILETDPKDATAHAKLGPLLIQLGKKTEALISFRIAADDLDSRGFADKALSLWLQIAQARVSDMDAWEKVTQFHVSRGRKAEGVKVLLEAASVQDDDRDGRPRAMRLLHDALVFEPKHVEAILMLAPLMLKEKLRGEARELLESALQWASGRDARRMRWQVFYY